MKKRERGTSKFGYVLMGIGGIMLLGLLNLGFLIPFAIASFFIYKGWNMIKGSSEGSYEPAVATPSAIPQVDPLDEWEKNITKR